MRFSSDAQRRAVFANMFGKVQIEGANELYEADTPSEKRRVIKKYNIPIDDVHSLGFTTSGLPIDEAMNLLKRVYKAPNLLKLSAEGYPRSLILETFNELGSKLGLEKGLSHEDYHQMIRDEKEARREMLPEFVEPLVTKMPSFRSREDTINEVVDLISMEPTLTNRQLSKLLGYSSPTGIDQVIGSQRSRFVFYETGVPDYRIDYKSIPRKIIEMMRKKRGEYIDKYGRDPQRYSMSSDQFVEHEEKPKEVEEE